MTAPNRHRSVRYPFDPSDVVGIDVELPAGSVEVVQTAYTYGWEGGTRTEPGVVITQRGNENPDAASLEATIVGIIDGVLTVHTPKSVHTPKAAPLDIRITVPSTASGTIRTDEANVTVSALHDLTVETTSGEVLVRRADGNLRMRGGTGELRTYDVAGDLDVESWGRVYAQTVNGFSRIVTDSLAHVSFPSQERGFDVTSRTALAIVGPRRETATEGQPARLTDPGRGARDPEKTVRSDVEELLRSRAVVRTFELDGPVILDAELDAGRIRVTGSKTETEFPDYTVRLMPGGVSAEAVAALDSLVVEPVPSEWGTTRLLVHGPTGGGSRLHAVEIECPAGVDLRCVAPDAFVRTGGTLRSVDVTTGGAVYLKNVTRDAVVKADGDVVVHAVGGDLGVRSRGAVTVNSAAGATVVAAATGATVKKVTGAQEYDVRSTSGGVWVGTTHAAPAADGTSRLTGTGPAPVPSVSKLPAGHLLARAVGGPSGRGSTLTANDYPGKYDHAGSKHVMRDDSRNPGKKR